MSSPPEGEALTSTRDHLTPEDFEQLLAGQGGPEAFVHLQNCPSCRYVWRCVNYAHAWLQRAPVLSAPPQLHTRVMQRLAPEQRGASWIWSIPLVCLLGGWLLLSLLVILTFALNVSTHWWPAVVATWRLSQDIGGASLSILWSALRAIAFSPWFPLGLITLAMGLGLWGWLLIYTKRKLLMTGTSPQ